MLFIFISRGFGVFLPLEVAMAILCEKANSTHKPVHEDIQGQKILTKDSQYTGQIESNYDEITDSFDSMNLKSELLRGM